MADTFKFELVSPERLLMSEDVTSVRVPGTDGEFTVFANHAPTLSTMRPGLMDVTTPDGKSQRIFIRGGFAEVQPESLTILAEQAVHADDLSKDFFRGEIETAEKRAADADDDDVKHEIASLLHQLREIEKEAGHA
ncbi:MAG: F0F1 ATP synthase subunit epsilon [Pseudomonadota bacterium]